MPRLPDFRLRKPADRPHRVEFLAAPPRFERPKRIHPRRVLPRVAEGMEREFHSLTPRAVLGRALAAPGLRRAFTDELSLVVNTELTSAAQQQTASNVGEPSTSINGQTVFYTGNWYAAMSSDGGQTFQFIDPAKEFLASDPPGSHFCCDQVVNYIASIDMFVWLLQYGPDTNNLQRLAFAKTADVVQGHWTLFDITTQNLGVPGMFMDFPDLAVGANFLYMTTNIFDASGNGQGSGVVRMPLSGIRDGQPTAQPFVEPNLQSFRVAQGCGATAFFAAHQNTSTLQVFSWPEGQDTPTPTSVGVSRWIGGNGYQSRTPDGQRWLDRADPRITGATMAGTELWFAWSVDSGSNLRPRPFVQIARINAQDLTLLENINVFDPDSAICYGALSTNLNAEVGISYMIGGGSRFPSHVVGILTGTRKDVLVAAGDRGPLPNQRGQGEWGDYLTVRPAFPNQKLFAATGYTLKGPGDGSNRDSTPRFVIFGRAEDAGGAAVPAGGGGAGGGGVVPVGGGGGTPPVGGGGGGAGPVVGVVGPFTDVNQLPVVSASVAAEIKAAVGIPQGPSPHALEAAMLPELVTKPGAERWQVKTGQDDDVGTVGMNVINGQDLGEGIVEATLEEMVRIPRPPQMANVTLPYRNFDRQRQSFTEKTIWRIEVTITDLKREADGDYHLVLKGASGETMIGEVPTATTTFVGNSPWLENITEARKEVDDKIVSQLSPASFALMDGVWVPRGSMSVQPQDTRRPPDTFCTPPEGSEQQMQPFKTQISPRRVRLTGVGLFDRVHNQTGVSQSNGIELHPILKIEWL